MSSSDSDEAPRQRAGQAGRARSAVRRYLRFGTHSIAEVRAYLKARHVSDSTSNTLLAECAQQGLVDDRISATLWASRLCEQGYAWTAIRDRLRAKGFDEPLINDVLQPLQRNADDATRARTLARARSRRRPPDGPHLARWLAHRGFDSDLIDRVLADTTTRPSDD